MNQKRKAIIAITMTGLTGIAATGCTWQYRRYKESKFRWNRINNNLKAFNASNIKDLPLDRLYNKLSTEK